MKNQEFQDKMNTIQNKIGEENSALIMDDIGILLSDNQNMNKEIEDKNEEIKKLKTRNESLMSVNANLLQQVPMEKDDKQNDNENEKKKSSFDFRTAFDEKRKF